MDRFAISHLPLLLAALVLGLTALNGCAAGDPNIAGARMELRNADYQRALELTDQAIAANPDNAEAYEVRGDIFMAMAEAGTDQERPERLASMRAAYERALEIEPDRGLVELKLLQAYGAQMNRGAAAYEEGAQDPLRYLNAAEAFASAAAVMPDSTDAYLYKGLALIQAGETSRAISPLEEAVQRDIDQPEAYFFLGQLYLTEDRADDAITVLETARDRFPENREIETELLNVYARTGQVDRAIAAYGAAVREHPEDAVLRYNYGSFLLQAQQYDDAATHLRRATELDPDAANAFYNLGAAYMNQAVELNEELAEMDHTRPEAGQLQAERDALLQQAVDPLERARVLMSAEGEDVVDVCRSLFRAYALLRMDSEARDAAACAGIELD